MDSFHQQIGLKFKEEAIKMLHLEFVRCWIGHFESRSDIPRKFWNVVMEKDGQDQFDWSCEKWRSITKSEVGREYPTYNTKKEWLHISHILRRNYVLKHAVEEKIAGRIEETGRRRRRLQQPLDNLKERRGYGQLKEEAPARTLWMPACGNVHGPFVRETTKCYS